MLIIFFFTTGLTVDGFWEGIESIELLSLLLLVVSLFRFIALITLPVPFY